MLTLATKLSQQLVKCLTCALLAMSSLTLSAMAATIYVSPSGADTNSGTIGSPLRTLDGARIKVASMNSNMSDDIFVEFRGGVYPFTDTVSFGVSDSGSNGHKVIYRAYESEVPIFDASVPVGGWSQYQGGNLYVANLSRTEPLRTLYLNSERLTLARSGVIPTNGASGTFNISGSEPWALDSGSTYDTILLSPTGLPGLFSNQSDMEIVNTVGFSHHIVSLDSVAVNGSNLEAELSMPMGAIALSQPVLWGAPFYHTDLGKNRFYLQNAFELLDAPGEFYYDESAQKLYVYPPNGTDLNTSTVTAPVSNGMVEILGNSTNSRVKDIVFEGIEWRGTGWNLHEIGQSRGMTTVQSNALYTKYFSSGNWHQAQSGGTSGYANTEVMPAAIQVSNASGIEIHDGMFEQMGSGAVNFGNDVVDSDIIGNIFLDISGSAISVGHPQNTYIGDGDFSTGVEGAPARINVKNNYVERASVEFLQTVPIAVFYSDDVHVDHNVVYDATYTGITMGWGWNNFYYNAPAGNASTVSRDNSIAENVVKKTMTELHDGGAIYTLGASPGTVISGNFVDDAGGASFGNGIYTDQSSSDMEIKCNRVENFNGTWWFVWGVGARVSNMDVHHNVVDQAMSTINAAGGNATNSVSEKNYNYTSVDAIACPVSPGLEPKYAGLLPGGSQVYARAFEAEAGILGGRATIGVSAEASNGEMVERLDLVGDHVRFENVAESSTLIAEYTSQFTGGIGVFVNGTRQGTLNFTSTGSWNSNFQIAVLPISIPAGADVEIRNDFGDQGLNLDKILFTDGASENIEAEEAVLTGSADICNTGDKTISESGVCYLHENAGLEVTSLLGGDKLEVRYASVYSGTVSVYVNGVFADKLNFSSTGGWFDNFTYASLDIAIPAGSKVKIEHAFGDPTDKEMNIDSIRISNEGFIGAEFHEAENTTLQSPANVCSISGASNSKGVCFFHNNAAMQFTAQTGGNELSINYASINNGSVSVLVDGVDVGDISFNSTGGWYSNFSYATLSVNIAAGSVVKLLHDPNDPGDKELNVDFIALSQ